MENAFLFDLDGTLTSVELLPLISKELGLEEEISRLTRNTMAGLVPFDASFRHRVELLADVPLETVAEIVCAAPVNELLMAWVKENRDNCWVVTGNLDCWVDPWIEMHGLQGFSSKAEIVDDRVTVGSIIRKEDIVADFADHRVIAIGDGANDAQMIADADVGIAAATVHPVPPVVLEVADFLFYEEEALCRALQRL